MSKVFLTSRLPATYNRQTFYEIFRSIETAINSSIDGFLFPVTTTAASYTVTSNDCIVLADATGGAITVTLQAADQAKKKRIMIKKIDASANAVTIAAAGSDTIDGASTDSLPIQYDTMELASDGANWFIV